MLCHIRSHNHYIMYSNIKARHFTGQHSTLEHLRAQKTADSRQQTADSRQHSTLEHFTAQPSSVQSSPAQPSPKCCKLRKKSFSQKSSCKHLFFTTIAAHTDHQLPAHRRLPVKVLSSLRWVVIVCPSLLPLG